MIEVKELTKRFNNLVAVDRLNFDVKPGEVFGLLGPNGAGKTTTLYMLCTILKPSSGTAVINGVDVTKQPSKVRKSIGIIFQEPSIDDRLTGRENLEMHANLYGVPRSEQKKRIDEVLELVELSDRADSLMRAYSGGMRRRLEIARALVHYPRVLFLDEPTLGLDPQTREHVWQYITELSKREDITMILTTHYMEEADKLCDRIAIIDHGNMIALDEPKRLKEELEGDVISIKTDSAQKLSERLSEAKLTGNMKQLANELELVVKKGNELIPRIVEVASCSGIRIQSISLREPTLEDVFLHFTGRKMRPEGTEEYHGKAMARRFGVR